MGYDLFDLFTERLDVLRIRSDIVQRMRECLGTR